MCKKMFIVGLVFGFAAFAAAGPAGTWDFVEDMADPLSSSMWTTSTSGSDAHVYYETLGDGTTVQRTVTQSLPDELATMYYPSVFQTSSIIGTGSFKYQIRVKLNDPLYTASTQTLATETPYPATLGPEFTQIAFGNGALGARMCVFTDYIETRRTSPSANNSIYTPFAVGTDWHTYTMLGDASTGMVSIYVDSTLITNVDSAIYGSWGDDTYFGDPHGGRNICGGEVLVDYVAFTAVPEPTTIGLLAVGLFVLIRRKR